jgi:4-alpha-glucanotransferase
MMLDLAGRRAGVLLHLSSLENALGRGGRAWIDWLSAAGFSVWQFLPLGPTGVQGSPYWVYSDAAGNPAFTDPAELPPLDSDAYQEFLRSEAQWLDDFACFEVLNALNQSAPWWSWPPEQRDRAPSALERLRREHARELDDIRAQQFAFAWQWQRLRAYAHERGVSLFGDVPFYLAPSSVETWAHREQFQLDDTGRPAAVAGVPPDYFSPTGQLWGNPLYDWDVMRRDGFTLWCGRFKRQLERVDLLRLDHFRAFAAHWAVPADALDARAGSWKRTPGWALLRTLRDAMGTLPIVAEDLGVITVDVEDLRHGFHLPGMRVLQFGFDGSGSNPHLPHMHARDSVVYTGTHDNDTTLGWYTSLDAATRAHVDFFLRAGRESMPDALIRAALGSVGALAVLPMQDILALGSEARLNTPGTVLGNWSWRLPGDALTIERAQACRALNTLYGRA